jgi:hypothetical protein
LRRGVFDLEGRRKAQAFASAAVIWDFLMEIESCIEID